MSRRLSCVNCGKTVNASAAKCPHCGGAQRELAGLKNAMVSADEAAALLLFHEDGPAADDEPSYGLIGSLFMPHRATRGLSRVVEIALTIAGLPAILGGMATLMLLPRTYHRARSGTALEGMALMAVVGGLGVATVLSLAGAGSMSFAAAIASSSALVARYAVQRMAVAARRPDLVGELEPPSELPVAIARGALPAARDPEEKLIAVPDSTPAAPGDEPSLLK